VGGHLAAASADPRETTFFWQRMSVLMQARCWCGDQQLSRAVYIGPSRLALSKYRQLLGAVLGRVKLLSAAGSKKMLFCYFQVENGE